MSPSWIFFDAGNTLIGLNYQLVVEALRAEGLDVREEALRSAETTARRDLDKAILSRWSSGSLPRTGWVEGKVWTSFWRQVIIACGGTPERSDRLVDAVLKVTRPASSWDRVDSTTPGVLDELAARGHRLGVISNSSGTLHDHLERIGLAGRFEIIIDSSRVGVEKPHPEIFRLALRQAGDLDATGALYVGDVYAIDVLGAAGAGMSAILFDPQGIWDPGWLRAGDPPCRRLRSLSELPAFIE